MNYKGYTGIVEFDDDGRIFHGEVVGLRDVITFQGQSVDELEKAMETMKLAPAVKKQVLHHNLLLCWQPRHSLVRTVL